MNEEEFEQLKSTVKQWLFHTGSLDPTNYANELILKFIEPREKQIVELKEEIHTWKEASSTNSYKAFQLQEENKTLSKHILELQNDKGELTDRCKELEAQIEKMKCWCNCKNYISCLEECCKKNISFEQGICYNCKKWEIREK